MSEALAISAANLAVIENNLRALHDDLTVLDGNVHAVDQHVDTVEGALADLTAQFLEFVSHQEQANRCQIAETRLVKLRQELETKFGHYAVIRRTTTGILEADDLGIIRAEVIRNATEELMLSTPGYWLAPCLVALSSWISDQPELAEKALREGIRRDDEKTSLLFALVCRRAGRKNACLHWTQRYLANQDEEALGREAIIVLDAFASGLLGTDTEGAVTAQIEAWCSRLAEKPGYTDKQISQWSAAILLKRPALPADGYPYLKKFSADWPQLAEVMRGALLHEPLRDYFQKIFDQPAAAGTLQLQLDKILNSLVQDFDAAELPVRKQEKFEQLVVDFQGSEAQAKAHMQVAASAFDEKKDFNQLLTDAAMNPKTTDASASTQKLAISMSRDWIRAAYQDVIAKARMQVPNDIHFAIDTFQDSTRDGEDETALLERFNTLIDQEKADALGKAVMTSGEKSKLWWGILAVLGAFLLYAAHGFFAFVLGAIGLYLLYGYYSRGQALAALRETLETQFEAKRDNNAALLRALLAEVVDFRQAFAEHDGKSQPVIDLLEGLSPNQFIRRMPEDTRRLAL